MSKHHPENYWLSVFEEPLANLTATTACLQFADLYKPGDSNLLIADQSDLEGGGKRRLRVYTGSTLQNTVPLPENVSSMCVLHTGPADKSSSPLVCVSAGPSVYVFRDNKPYYKFTLPVVEPNPLEVEAWELSKSDKGIPEDGEKNNSEKVEILTLMLTELRERIVLCGWSTALLLASQDPEKAALVWEEWANTIDGKPPGNSIANAMATPTVITAMATIKKSTDDSDAESYLILGTEHKIVYVINQTTFTIVEQFQMSSPITHISAIGLYDVSSGIYVATRDCTLYALRSNLCNVILQCESYPVGLVAVAQNNVVVGVMSGAIYGYHEKGRRTFTLRLKRPITAMTQFQDKLRSIRGFMVALDREVRLYGPAGGLLLTYTAASTVLAMRFGQFTREDGALAMVLRGGGLSVKVLSKAGGAVLREFKGIAASGSGHWAAGPVPEQSIPLDIPKKTRLYLDLAAREKENAIEMHQSFLRDMTKLRLVAAKAFANSICSGTTNLPDAAPTTEAPLPRIKLDLTLSGVTGPTYRLHLQLQNVGIKALVGMTACFAFSSKVWQLEPEVLLQSAGDFNVRGESSAFGLSSVVTWPILVPGVVYSKNVKVRCLVQPQEVERTATKLTEKALVAGKVNCLEAEGRTDEGNMLEVLVFQKAVEKPDRAMRVLVRGTVAVPF